MNHFLALIILLVASTYSFGQSNLRTTYSIIGHLSGWEGQFIYFSCKGSGKSRVWDSTIVKDNTFKFKGTIAEPSNGFITILQFNRVQNLKDKNITERLFLSPSEMTISLKLDSFHDAKLVGSKYQSEYRTLESSKKKLYDKIEPLSNLYDSLNAEYLKLEKQESEKMSLETKMDSIRTKIDALSEKCSIINKAFFAKNPNSYITTYLLQDYYSTLSLKELKYYYNKMLPSTKKWEYGIKLKEAISSLQNGSPGSAATNFSEPDIKGDSLSLLQFRGKYILLDFWASWCKPCRAGNPELIRLYKKYKEKGIEFIGIADDNGSEDKWKLAVEKDNVNIWRHILDKRIGNAYAVHSIPLQILIDPNGKIIGRFGEGGEPNKNISKSLERLFGQ
jgi:thiol-disulfide isomerase/thioredoxin